MERAGGRLSDVHLSAQCPYCGFVQQLGASAVARAAAGDIAAAKARWATDAARGAPERLLRMAEDGVFGGLYGPVASNMLFMILLMAAAGAIASSSALGGRGALSSAAGAAAPMVGALVGLVCAWLMLKRRIRSVLRPMLAAAPKNGPTTESHCRNCGGDLPAPKGSFATCSYCDAPNLVSRSALEAVRKHLGAITEAERRAAASNGPRVGALVRRVGWTMTAGITGGVVLGAAVRLALGA
jgi:hypothetical protein